MPDMSQFRTFAVGDIVRAFHPGTLGVVKTGRIVKLGNTYAHVDFGALGNGIYRVLPADLLSVEQRDPIYEKWDQLRRDGSTRMSIEEYRACTEPK